MLKVLLVDDEPFILQGLKILIDWEKEGFEIAAALPDGSKALDYLRENEVDLIIADIKMPQVTGLELLEKIRRDKLSNAYFVILSGYSDFSFAQAAIRYRCTDYLLKPVDKDELCEVLQKVCLQSDNARKAQAKSKDMERAFLARNLISLIGGKSDGGETDYVKEHLKLSEGIRYVDIDIKYQGMDEISQTDSARDEDIERRAVQKKLFYSCCDFLGDDAGHCIFDVSGHEKLYDIGFIYCDYMAKNDGQTLKEYLKSFSEYINKEMGILVEMMVGREVKDISAIAISYGTSCMLRSFHGFKNGSDIYYYEDEDQLSTYTGGVVLCKDALDDILLSVEQNDIFSVKKNVRALFDEMNEKNITGKTLNLNTNYLLFSLIHLASKLDDEVNQEEILRIISESTFEEGIKRGSRVHFEKFICEYTQYISQLRRKISKGVLGDIESEIRENYADNITLRSLGEKYFINSAYLGQLFKKKFGASFKDYLNNYRIEQAALMLVNTDSKIYEIAEGVGYHDADYFVNRFISVKGCTPAKYRRRIS